MLFALFETSTSWNALRWSFRDTSAPVEVEPNGHSERYLKTKREKLNHLFERY